MAESGTFQIISSKVHVCKGRSEEETGKRQVEVCLLLTAFQTASLEAKRQLFFMICKA